MWHSRVHDKRKPDDTANIDNGNTNQLGVPG